MEKELGQQERRGEVRNRAKNRLRQHQMDFISRSGASVTLPSYHPSPVLRSQLRPAQRREGRQRKTHRVYRPDSSNRSSEPTCPLLSATSFSTALMRSSNSPRYLHTQGRLDSRTLQ